VIGDGLGQGVIHREPFRRRNGSGGIFEKTPMGGHIKIGGQPFDDAQDFQPSAVSRQPKTNFSPNSVSGLEQAER
jgi:hypothetical protein